MCIAEVIDEVVICASEFAGEITVEHSHIGPAVYYNNRLISGPTPVPTPPTPAPTPVRTSSVANLRVLDCL